MATPMTLPAVHRDLALHLSELSRDDDPDHEMNEQEADTEDEAEMVDMQADDEAYLDDLERRGPTPRASADIRSNRPLQTSSPEAYDEYKTPPAQFERTVTVTEPVPVENTSVDMDAPSLPYRRRLPHKLANARTNTTRTYTTFTDTLGDAWERRHDRGHRGFWAAAWRWTVGAKYEQFAAEDQPDYIPPKYRWTPILSGLLQPFSILLEIPGLTEHWYVHSVDNVPVAYLANPAILDVGLAISMACGVVANLALISRFLERRVLASTIVTIVGLSIHDIINIAAVTVFGVVHRFNDGFTYSEAFWLCVCSTVASMVTNITLIFDLVKTKDFGRSGSGLTPKQRSLVIIVMLLLVYIAIGALCLNFLLPSIAFQNVLYFAVVTIETIGFGDIQPSTLGAEIFIFFWVPLGILNLAVAVGTARDTLVESWNTTYRRRRHEVLRRHRLRKQQRAEEAIRRAAIERKLAAIGASVFVDAHGGGVRGGAKTRKLNVRALTKEQLQQAENEALNAMASRQASAPSEPAPPAAITQQAIDEAQRQEELLNAQSLLSEEGYREFQAKVAQEEKRENIIKFVFAFGLFLAFWLVGATVFHFTEGWSWFIGFYFCFVAFTTIGYGDVAPQTPAGRAFFIIWAIFGVATVTLLIAVLTEAYANRYKSALVQKKTRRAITAVREMRGHDALPTDQTATESRRDVARLPHAIVDVLKEWHQHVSAARQAAVDGHESQGMRTVVSRLMNAQGLTEAQKAELAADPDSRRALFWNSYERTAHDLLSLAEDAIGHHEGTARELEVLRELTRSSSPAIPRTGWMRRTSRTRLAVATPLGQVKEAWSSQPGLEENWDLERGTVKGELYRRMSG
ncbi:Potassium channel [Cryptotrichosporon argae]